MSLVNQMLRDLEQRQAGAAMRDGAVLSGLGGVDAELLRRPRVVRRGLLVLGAAGVLAGAGYLGWPALAQHLGGPEPRVGAQVDDAHALRPDPPARGLAAAREASAPAPGRRPPGPPPARAGDPGSATARVAGDGGRATAGASRDARRLAQDDFRLRLAAGADDRAGAGEAHGWAPDVAPGGGLTAEDFRLLRLAATLEDSPSEAAPRPRSAPAREVEASLAAGARAGVSGSSGAETARAARRGEGAGRDPRLAALMEVETGAGAEVTKRPVPASPESNARALYREALRRFRAGDAAGGEQRLAAALAADPAHIQARQVLAARLARGRRLEEAARILGRGLRLTPGHAQLAKMHARVLAELGRPAEALATLGEASPAASDDPAYHALRAALLQRTGAHRAAVSAYEDVLAVRPAEGVWWMGLGISLEALGERERALEAYRRAGAGGKLRGEVRAFVERKLAELGA